MKANMGALDRVLRFAAAVLIDVLFLMGLISGPLAMALFVVATVFLLTALFGVCPLYMPFGISTRKAA